MGVSEMLLLQVQTADCACEVAYKSIKYVNSNALFSIVCSVPVLVNVPVA